MTSEIAKKRWAAVVALGIAGAALTYIAFGGIEKNLVYFWDVDQLLSHGREAYGATVRLGGMVQKGSVQWDPNTLDLRFRVGMGPEPDARSVVVKASEAPPQMFQEAMGVVVEGTYDGSVFHADRVMVKHSNEYRPPHDGEHPEEIYKTLIRGP